MRISPTHETRQTSQTCCFHLDSAGAMNDDIEEDHTGHLHLAGSFQQGAFCLDGGKVQDATGNQCFIKSPNYQFQCYQKGVVGDTAFDLVAANNGSTKLVYDGGPGTYLACSEEGGDSYEIYSTLKADKTGCLEVSLVLTEQSGECILSDPTPTPDAGDACSAEDVEDDGSDWVPTPACSVAASAPSLAPIKIGSPNQDADDGLLDTGVNATITSIDSTVFNFSIPRNFTLGGSKLCALEFRLPYCGDLPDGYPCFQFTGSEQELLSNSGMLFSVLGGEDALPSWNDTVLQQVIPGDKKVLGTFECGASTYGNGTQDVAWLASSVRDFGLQYQQAGTGSSEFDDGVGAFIVQCS